MLRRALSPAALPAFLAGCAAFAECVSHDEFRVRDALAYCNWAVNMGCEGGDGTFEACLKQQIPIDYGEPTGWEYAQAQCGLEWDECKGGRCLWVLEQMHQSCDREPWRAQFEAECGEWNQGADVQCGIDVP